VPLYEYECAKDGRFELIRQFSDPPLKKCPKCGRPVEKLASAPAIQFKGTGWYVTDYAKKSGAKNGDESKRDSKTDGKSESNKGDSKSENKADSKTAESKSTDSSASKDAKDSTPSTSTKESSAPKGSSPT